MVKAMNKGRVIGTYTGEERGPLLICLAGIHGNEPAGVHALEILFHLLDIEPQSNPDFVFKGRVIGILGNLAAREKRERFLQKDLNRIWTTAMVNKVRSQRPDNLRGEERELRELIDLIEQEIVDYEPEQLVILDLHTTSAEGGIFSVATDDPESIRIAVELHAPVIKGMLKGIKGSTLHYFTTQRLGIPTVGVAFEAGQHDDPLSVNRCLAAVINCLRTLGCVQAEQVENRYDQLLQEYSKGLPKVAELVFHHPIKPGDQFAMVPDFQNFQPVHEGQILAADRRGEIRSPLDARILMPHYQKRGDDGFFLIREIDF